MMAIRIAQALYAVPIGHLGLGGWTYATRTSLMPHHEAAIGVRWGQLPPDLQLLMLSFLHVIGALHIALALALAAAAWWGLPKFPRTVPGVILVSVGGFYAAAAIVAGSLAHATDADPPMTGIHLAAAAIAVAVPLAVVASRSQRADDGTTGA